MAKCPNPNCQSTEFKSEKISLDGYRDGAYVIVCKKCDTVIGIAPRSVKLLLDDISGKR
jgi:aspartate carbamoyltransferase regulatory subunit